MLPPEEREKRKSFECKRKQHYNEFQAIKMARALMDEDNSEVRVVVGVIASPIIFQEDEKCGGKGGSGEEREEGGEDAHVPMETGQ